MKNSRRDFLKGFGVALLALGFNGANAFSNQSATYARYFIKDLQCESVCDSRLSQNLAIQKSKILAINGDISDIYVELKCAFENKAIVAGQSSEATFFVLRTMAAGYGLRVAYSDKKNGVHSWILAPTSITL